MKTICFRLPHYWPSRPSTLRLLSFRSGGPWLPTPRLGQHLTITSSGHAKCRLKSARAEATSVKDLRLPVGVLRPASLVRRLELVPPPRFVSPYARSRPTSSPADLS